MTGDEKDFLARWSRRKREAAAGAEKPAARGAEPAPALPPVEQLTPESDFSAFMSDRVGDGLRRAALKRLFADPRFNVIDQMDIYIDDYTKGEAISAEMLAQLEHSKSTLFGPTLEPADEVQDGSAAAPAEAPPVLDATAPTCELAPPDTAKAQAMPLPDKDSPGNDGGAAG